MATLKIPTSQLPYGTKRSKSKRPRRKRDGENVFPNEQVVLRSTFEYRIIRKLGDGSTGRAFLACEYDSIDSFRLVALKMLHTPEDDELQSTFILEAKLMRLMNHPNILTVYGFEKGTSAFERMLSSLGVTESYESFMIMEYVQGYNLDDFIRLHHQRGVLVHPYIATHICAQVARGLAYAHDFRHPGISAHGVIHRDINPANVLIHEDGRIKITDFGIAYPFDPLSKNPGMCGTYGYIAPEVLDGKRPDARADVYSVALLLELMLTGRSRLPLPPPHSSVTDVEVQRTLTKNHPFDAKTYRDLPPRLIDICQNATSPDPQARYQAATDFALDLDLYLRDCDSVIGPQQLAVYVDGIQSPSPIGFRSREYIMIGGKDTLDLRPTPISESQKR
jgi:serine/threonine protein kinase